MNINELPNELLCNIFENLIPDKSCNINDFKNYFLVNKLWNKILNSNTIINTFSKNKKVFPFLKAASARSETPASLVALIVE